MVQNPPRDVDGNSSALYRIYRTIVVPVGLMITLGVPDAFEDLKHDGYYALMDRSLTRRESQRKVLKTLSDAATHRVTHPDPPLMLLVGAFLIAWGASDFMSAAPQAIDPFWAHVTMGLGILFWAGAEVFAAHKPRLSRLTAVPSGALAVAACCQGVWLAWNPTGPWDYPLSIGLLVASAGSATIAIGRCFARLDAVDVGVCVAVAGITLVVISDSVWAGLYISTGDPAGASGSAKSAVGALLIGFGLIGRRSLRLRGTRT